MKSILSSIGLSICALASILCLSSCNGSKGNRKALLPNVSGKAGEVIVVLSKGNWDSNLGNDVRELLAADCPWLANKEPLYSLVNVTPSNFVDLFKVHRNIVFFDINPQVANEEVVYRRDVWSHPQCLVQISAGTAEKAAELLKENGETIINYIEQAERDRVITNSIRYEAKEIAPQVKTMIGGSPHFPSGYKLLKKTEDFIWIEDEKQYTTQGVFVYKYPISGNGNDLEIEVLLKKRNEILKNNVPGTFENTYMTTTEYIPPTLSYIKYRNREFAQMRGFWEVYNDYMGGPFVSHAFYSQDGKEVIVLDAWVYAPRFDKRLYLRQVESILYSFEWENVNE